MTALRKSQNSCSDGLPRHGTLPHTVQALRNARYGEQAYCSADEGQSQVAACRYGIPSSSNDHHFVLDTCLRLLQLTQPGLSPAARLLQPDRATSGPRSSASPLRSSPLPRLRSQSRSRSHSSSSPASTDSSSNRPAGALADVSRLANVECRLCQAHRGCGRTAVLGDTRRLSARLAPAGRPSAGDLNSVSLCECGGVCSCRESYLLASRAPRKCTDTSVRSLLALTPVSSLRSLGLSQSCCGRSKHPRISPQSQRPVSATPRAGSPENSSRRPASSPRSSSKSQDATEPRKRHRWGEAQRFTDPSRPDISKTERSCIHDGCTIVRVTRHESNEHWVEFWKDGERIEGDHTPPCEGVS